MNGADSAVPGLLNIAIGGFVTVLILDVARRLIRWLHPGTFFKPHDRLFVRFRQSRWSRWPIWAYRACLFAEWVLFPASLFLLWLARVTM